MNLTPAEARSRFEDGRRAILGTADETGQPHVVPVVYVVSPSGADAGHVYIPIDAKPKRSTNLKRLRNIAANPNVSLLVDEYAEDWTRLWWSRADGAARIAEFAELPDGLLATFQARYPWYVEHPPTGPVIEVVVKAWSGWAFTAG
jgi:PPOX class probable F420-dependent enzyme